MRRIIIWTRLNQIIAYILWALGAAVLLTNILGLWGAWHLTGYGYMFLMVCSLLVSLIVLLDIKTAPRMQAEEVPSQNDVVSVQPDFRMERLSENFLKTYLRKNRTVLIVTIAVSLFTVFVSFRWFW